MIESNQISVVMQGPIVEAQHKVIVSNVDHVRSVLPKCELIIATWTGGDVSVLSGKADRVLELDDPGTTTLGWDNKCNIDRQLRSVHAGLRVATRPYAIRMRLDTTLENDRFLEAYWAMLMDGTLRPATLFKQRVLATSIYFRDAAKSNYLFHPSDIFQMGLRSDLLELWEAPLVQSKQSKAVQLALVPEQYIWICYLLSKGLPAAQLDAQRFWYRSMLMSEWSLATNWWVVDGKGNGVILPDRFLTSNLPEKTHYESEWRDFAVRAGKQPRMLACRWNVLRKFTRKVKWP